MNISWIMESLDKLGSIGRNEKGITRLAFSEEDRAGREYLLSLIKEAGLDYRIDAFGNIFAMENKTYANNKKVATGSHIDTVYDAGAYDGTLGVISSLAAIMNIKNQGLNLSHPIELIVFQAEESSRFGHSTMGSKLMAGKFGVLEKWEKAVDKKGVSLSEALKENGLDFNNLKSCLINKDDYKSFLEIHIDQSRYLINRNVPVGIVEGISAPMRVKVRIEGEASHSGATEMSDRKDALVMASNLVLFVRDMALKYEEKKSIATVGKLDVIPGAMNVVPGLAEMFVDIRGINADVIDEIYNNLEKECDKVAKEYGGKITLDILSKETPVVLNDNISNIIEASCKDLNIPYVRTISGAGHDAMNLAPLMETGMIFVRNVSGTSHHISEFAEKDDIEQGFKVLTETLIRLAK